MTKWFDLYNKISDLRSGLKDKPVEHTLDAILQRLSEPPQGFDERRD